MNRRSRLTRADQVFLGLVGMVIAFSALTLLTGNVAAGIAAGVAAWAAIILVRTQARRRGRDVDR